MIGIIDANAIVGFLERWAPLVAYLAIIPWLIALYRLLSTRVNIDGVKQLELGFGIAGQTVALDGVAIALNNSMIVSDLRVSLRKDADKSDHRLDWLMSRQHLYKGTTTAGFGMEASMEVARPFPVPAESVVKFNILFSATDWAQQAAAICQRVTAEWLKYTQQNPGVPLTTVSGGPPTVPGPAFQQFSGTPIFQQARGDLQKLVDYWVIGSYRITLEARAYGSRLVTRKTWSFAVDSTQIQALQSNVQPLLQGACNQLPPNWIWGYAYPKLTSISKEAATR